MNTIKDPCVYCGESTVLGSGRFVNRIPCNDGWGCAECSGVECKRCDKQIYLDCEITPDQCYGDDADDYFSDGYRFVCEDCLTTNESKKKQVILMPLEQI